MKLLECGIVSLSLLQLLECGIVSLALRQATVEEQEERQDIYAHHVAAEAALAASTAATASADEHDPAHTETPLDAPATDADA